MNFGILNECYVREGKSHTQAFDDTFEQVAAAESLGFDSVWVVEQHFRPWAAVLPSPMVMASAIATAMLGLALLKADRRSEAFQSLTAALAIGRPFAGEAEARRILAR